MQGLFVLSTDAEFSRTTAITANTAGFISSHQMVEKLCEGKLFLNCVNHLDLYKSNRIVQY